MNEFRGISSSCTLSASFSVEEVTVHWNVKDGPRSHWRGLTREDDLPLFKSPGMQLEHDTPLSLHCVSNIFWGSLFQKELHKNGRWLDRQWWRERQTWCWEATLWREARGEGKGRGCVIGGLAIRDGIVKGRRRNSPCLANPNCPRHPRCDCFSS